MAQRKNQGAKKADAVISKYYLESGAEDKVNFTNTVNWATAEEIEELKKPILEDYYEAISNKVTKPVSEVEIEIEANQKRLNLIFRNGLNLYDIGNPQYGVEDKTNRDKLEREIKLANPSENNVSVMYAGDLFGDEWKIKDLNNAKIITVQAVNKKDTKKENNEDVKEQDVEEVKKALFFGLNDRKKALMRDIRTVLSQGANVYLFNGRQEHEINKYFKIDILQEVVDYLKDPRVQYIKGAKTIVNVCKKKGNGRKVYAKNGIAFLTNNSSSKAQSGQTAVNASKQTSGSTFAQIEFYSNTNTVGKKDTNAYYTSSQAMFYNTSRGKMPKDAPNSYNVFSLNIDDKGSITLLESVNMPQVDSLEMLTYMELKKREYILEVLTENIEKDLSATLNIKQFTETDYVRRLKNQQSRLKKQNELEQQEQSEIVAEKK